MEINATAVTFIHSSADAQYFLHFPFLFFYMTAVLQQKASEFIFYLTSEKIIHSILGQ